MNANNEVLQASSGRNSNRKKSSSANKDSGRELMMEKLMTQRL